MKTIKINNKEYIYEFPINNLENTDAKELELNHLVHYYITYILKDSCRDREIIFNLIYELLNSEKGDKMRYQLESNFNCSKYSDDFECVIELNKKLNKK